MSVPYALQQKHQEEYLSWTKAHLSQMTQWLLQQNIPFFRWYVQWGLVTLDTVEQLRSLAAQQGDTETVSALLDWLKQNRPGFAKEYDL